MTDDRYTINEPKGLVEALEEIVERVEKHLRDDVGISRAFSELTTLGACAELMVSAKRSAENAFLMELPGIPLEEQKALLDRFRVLWSVRQKQVERSIRYAGKAYDVTRKEVDE